MVLVIVTGVIILHIKAPAMFTQRVEKELSNLLNPDGEELYDLEIREVKFSSIFRKITFPYILIRPKEELYENTEKDSLPDRLFHLEIRDFSVSSDGIIDFVRNKDKISFGNINLPHVLLTVFENPDGRKAKEQSSEEESEMPQRAEVKNLHLHLISMDQRLFADTAIMLLSAKHIDFSGGISHEKSKEDTVPVILLKNYALQAGAIGFFPQEELYSYHCDSIQMMANDSIVNLFSLRVTPLYGKLEFKNHLTYQTDRMDVQVESIALIGFDPNLLINKNQLSLSQITINSAHIGVLRDRNLPLDPSRRPLMPVKLMRTAPLPFYVHEIELNVIDVIYSELPEDATTEGVVPITGIRGSISNFTNMPDSLQRDSMMLINTAGQFFEEAQLTASFDYNLMDMNGGYRARGDLSGLDFTRLNPVLMPLVSVEVEDGMHEKNTFFFSGNDVKSTGEIEMHYSDLNITLEPDRSKLRQDIVNWAGRNLLYHPSNPASNNELRTGTIDFERDVTRFVFHYWWNCYLTGIKETVLRDHVDL